MAEHNVDNYVKYFIYGRPIPLIPNEPLEPEEKYALSVEELFEKCRNAGEHGQPKLSQVHCVINKEKNNMEIIDFAQNNYDPLNAIWFGSYNVDDYHDNLIYIPKKPNKYFTIYGVQYSQPNTPVEYELPVYFSENVSCDNNQEAIDYLCSKYDRIIKVWEGQFNPRVDTKEPIYVEGTEEEDSATK